MQKTLSYKIMCLIDALKLLPGVGKKTSQRLSLHLLNNDKESALKIADAIYDAVENIKHCQICQTLTDKDICDICSDNNISNDSLCVVESMLDMLSIRDAGIFKGKYFVLNGRISPLDGVGPRELHLDKLIDIVATRKVKEVILAISPTIEGETTAHFIDEMLQSENIEVSRIGFGVPFGSELEYLDQQTLSHAFSRRTLF